MSLLLTLLWMVAPVAQADTPQAIRQSAQAVVSRQLTQIIDERELLKRYLLEVERRTEIETQNELARIALQREIFQSYDRQWWQSYADAHRQDAIEQYWSSYRAGENYTARIMNGSAGNGGCKFLREFIKGQGLPTPPAETASADPNFQDAFKRGVVSAHPECFVESALGALRAFDQEISGIKSRLLALEEKIRIYRPDEAELLALLKKIQADFVTETTALADGQIVRLQEAVNLDATQLDAFKKLTGIIAARIDCENLRSRRGRKQSCAVPVVPAPFAVNRDAAFKMLFLKQEPGVYQQDLDVKGLYEAISTFLAEVRPNDPTVRGLYSQLQTLLTKMDDTRVQRLANVQSTFAAARTESQQNLALSYRNHWREYFPQETQKQLIEAFASLKERIEAYVRLELSNVEEARLLTTIEQAYRRTLDLAASIQMSLKLPNRPIYLELTDQAHTRITYDGAPIELPVGYLLGLTGEEVSYWSGRLRLEN